jgi:glycosyltransferase involved in cell wall biosynthesis
LAILLTYGIDNSIQGALTKGNFDQMKVEVENLSKLSKVYLLTRDSQCYSYLFNENIEHLPCNYFSQSDTTLGKSFGSIIFFLVGLISIVRRLKEIDVIVSDGTTAVHAALANFFFHKPHILFLHYFAYKEQFLLKRKFLSYILQRIEFFTTRNSSSIIARTDSLRDEVIMHGAKSVSVIPNFVDLKEITKLSDRDILRRRLRFDGKTKVVLFVGRLHRVKNIDTLLKSFSRMNNLNDCTLVIIGDGPEKQHLVDLAESLGISNKVLFEGFMQRELVLEYMKASDVLVLPSLIEGLPRVVLEAWAAELLVVASRRPGLENLIDDKVDGLLFDLGADERLAETIAIALDGKVATKIISNARKRVARYDAARVLSDERKAVMKFLSNRTRINWALDSPRNHENSYMFY